MFVSRISTLVLTALLASCQPATETITFFHTASLSPLVETVSKRFEGMHPGVAVVRESGAGLDIIRKLPGRTPGPDLLAVSDRRLLERLLDSGSVNRAFEFLGNDMVLATRDPEFLSATRLSGRSHRRWYEILLERDYSYGIADPDRDPTGYCAHMVWKLAEMHYERPGLYRRLLNGLDSRWICSESGELAALLRADALDLAFLYRSTALQTGLAFLDLPPQIALGETLYGASYSQATLRVTGKVPDSMAELKGVPIRYGVALMRESSPWAERYLNYLLSPEVQALYRELGYRNIPVTRIEPW
ncbi:MAG: substrate-binding domain-containing protein [Acidobacteriota bacterium]|nr:substrate-binding domain-containing protein [Acidobacteriota bacterium]